MAVADQPRPAGRPLGQRRAWAVSPSGGAGSCSSPSCSAVDVSVSAIRWSAVDAVGEPGAADAAQTDQGRRMSSATTVPETVEMTGHRALHTVACGQTCACCCQGQRPAPACGRRLQPQPGDGVPAGAGTDARHDRAGRDRRPNCDGSRCRTPSSAASSRWHPGRRPTCSATRSARARDAGSESVRAGRASPSVAPRC